MSEERRGRKSCFSEKIGETIIRLIEEGKTEEQIARIIGVSRTTLANWKGKYPEFLYAVREAREIADELVEASLFRRAIGYSHPEEKVFQYQGLIITHKTEKHYPPDTQAAMFWLRNRQPDRWREKNEGDVKINNSNNMQLKLEQLTDEQLDAKMNELLEKYKKSNDPRDECLDARVAQLLDQRKESNEGGSNGPETESE